MIAQLPQILRWDEFKEVGFYDFLKLKECLLKAMTKNLILSVPLPPDPPTRASLVGKFHHKLSELVLKCESKQDLSVKIEEEIVALQTVVDLWPQLKSGSVSGWDEINFFAISALKNFQKKTGIKSGVRLGSEEKLASSDRMFVGRPDFFTIEGRKAELKELKTTSLKSEAGLLRDEYEQQLWFYSVLLFDNFDIDSVHGVLLSHRSEQIEKDIQRPEAKEYKALMATHVRQANIQLKNSDRIEELTSTSKIACENCNKRLLCGRFIENQFQLGIDRDVFVLKGKVTDISKEHGSPITSLEITHDVGDQPISIDIPSNAAGELNVQDHYLITNLKYTAGKFFWSQNSEIYHYD